MNREQRRAAKFKRVQRNRNFERSSSTGGMGAIPLAQQYSEEEAARLCVGAGMAWHRLTHGDGTTDDFDMLATCLNVAAIMAADIDDLLLEVIDRGMHSVAEIKARHGRTGRFGVDAQALRDVPYALDAHDEIIKHSTPMQTITALRTAMKMVDDGAVIVPDAIGVDAGRLINKPMCLDT